MEMVFKGVKGAGVLDYVAAWYLKAARYIQQTKIKAAFVSTNSVCQGEQTGIIWSLLILKYNIKIHFAHRTFSWTNEAKGNAAVHVIIVGFANFNIKQKSLFEYETLRGEPHETKVGNINPYLIEGNDNFVTKRRYPLCSVPEMIKGSMPNDGGFYLFSGPEKEEFITLEPQAAFLFRRYIGGYEFLNNVERWCLWLANTDPSRVKQLKLVLQRVAKVREIRLLSTRETTKKDAETPMQFGENRQPDSDYLALPEVSSENRRYVPIGFVSKDVIASNKIYMVPNANMYLFGILNSSMHMTWVNNISGRLKSDISYSTGIVYNNFSWPENPSEKQITSIETAAQKILDVRASFADSSLADLYHPLTMPPALTNAHQELDKAVDLAYRPQPFINETKRMEFLFELYEKYTAGLFAKEKVKKVKKVN